MRKTQITTADAPATVRRGRGRKPDKDAVIRVHYGDMNDRENRKQVVTALRFIYERGLEAMRHEKAASVEAA